MKVLMIYNLITQLNVIKKQIGQENIDLFENLGEEMQIQQQQIGMHNESIDSHLTYGGCSDKPDSESEEASYISYDVEDEPTSEQQSILPQNNRCIQINVNLKEALGIMPYGFSFANQSHSRFGISISSNLSHEDSSSSEKESCQSESSNQEHSQEREAEYHIDLQINRFDPDDQPTYQYFASEIPFTIEANSLLMIDEDDDNEESPAFRGRESLTEEEIKGFPLMCWQKVHEMMNKGQRCSCCLEEYRIGDILRVVTCMHRFHFQCIDEWLLHRSTCPLCKLNFIA